MSYINTILEDDPVAYWPLNEDSGTTVTDEAGSRTGALDGTYTLGITTAPDGLIASLGLTNGHFSVSDTPLREGYSQFSIEWWMKKDDTNSSYIMSRGNQDDIIVDFNAGKIEFFGGNLDRSGSAIDMPTDNAWHHYVYTYDAETLRGYVDGTEVTTHAQATTLSGSLEFRWGRSAGDGSPLSGGLSDVAVYYIILSPTQIQTHYDMAFVPPGPSLEGNATTEEGDAVDHVVIYRLDTLECVQTVQPSLNGDWESSALLDGDYLLTYFASGYQPLTHGPYTVDHSGT